MNGEKNMLIGAHFSALWRHQIHQLNASDDLMYILSSKHIPTELDVLVRSTPVDPDEMGAPWICMATPVVPLFQEKKVTGCWLLRGMAEEI